MNVNTRVLWRCRFTWLATILVALFVWQSWAPLGATEPPDFLVPDYEGPAFSSIAGLATAPDGKVWISDRAAGRPIGFDPDDPSDQILLYSSALTVELAEVAPAGDIAIDAAYHIYVIDELLPTTPGDSGVAATLSNTGGGGNATVTVATYADNPTGVEISAVGDSYVDLNLIGVDATDVVNALLYHPSTVTGVQEASLELLYFDGSEWVHVLSSGGQEPFKNTGDNLDGTVSGGRWSVTFNTSSTPGITALGGTVFTFVTSASVDTDSDGVPDIIDNCARSANPNQADSDNDGKGNTCDADGLVPAACAAISIDNVILGASGNDTLTGTTFNDLVLAMSGNDTVTGNGGNGGDDCVDSGNGNDTVTTRQRRHHRHRRQRQH